MAEIARVLARPRLRRFLHAGEAAAIVENIAALALVPDDPPAVDLSPDPADNPIRAIAGRADLIVSGDRKRVLALAEGASPS